MRIVLDAVLLSLLTAAVFGVAFYGFVRAFTEPRTHAVVGYFAAELGGLAEAYERQPEADRAAFLAAVAAGSRGRLALDDLTARGRSAPGDSMEDEGLVAEFARQLGQRFPSGRLAMTHEGSGLHLWFALPAPGGSLQWVRLPVAHDTSRWSFVSLAMLGLLVVVGAFGSVFLAWRLRDRVGGMERALQRLRPGALRQAGAAGASLPAARSPASGGDTADPQAHLEALAGRLEQAARERAMQATAVSGDLRLGLLQLAGSEPLLATPQASRCVRQVETALGRLERFCVVARDAPWPGGGRRPGPWRDFLADLATVAGLFIVAVALSAAVVAQGVFVARVQSGVDLAQTVLSGIQATYAALPDERREDYLQSLVRYSGGELQRDEPQDWPIASPQLVLFRDALERLRAAFPDLEMQTTPIPHSSLWVRLAQADRQGPWLRLSVPVLRSAHWLVLAGLAVLSLAVAAVVVLQARRRMVWFNRTLDAVDPEAPVQPLQEEDSEPDAGLTSLLRDMHQAAGTLLREHDREELGLAQLSDELGQALEALRAAVPHAKQAPATAGRLDAMRKRVSELDGFARRRHSLEEVATDLNAELRDLRRLLMDRGGAPLLWMPGGVPLADIPRPDLRRLFFYLLHEVERHGDAPIVVSTQLMASHVVLEIAGQPHMPVAAPAPGDDIGLAVVRRIVAVNAGRLQLEAGSDGGLRAQVWLRPARVA